MIVKGFWRCASSQRRNTKTCKVTAVCVKRCQRVFPFLYSPFLSASLLFSSSSYTDYFCFWFLVCPASPLHLLPPFFHLPPSSRFFSGLFSACHRVGCRVRWDRWTGAAHGVWSGLRGSMFKRHLTDPSKKWARVWNWEKGEAETFVSSTIQSNSRFLVRSMNSTVNSNPSWVSDELVWGSLGRAASQAHLLSVFTLDSNYSWATSLVLTLPQQTSQIRTQSGLAVLFFSCFYDVLVI